MSSVSPAAKRRAIGDPLAAHDDGAALDGHAQPSRRALAREPRAQDLHRREPALDLPAPRAARSHVEGGVSALQNPEKRRPRGFERREARAAAELDGRTVGQREARARRGRVGGDEGASIAEAQRPNIAAPGGDERDDHGAREGERADGDAAPSAAGVGQTSIDPLPDSSQRGLLRGIAQHVLERELEVAHAPSSSTDGREACDGREVCARTTASASPRRRLMVASEQPHAAAASVRSRPST
jgi:hypothetical protein